MYVNTKRLILKAIAQTDLDDLATLLMDDVVKKTYMVPDFASREEALKLAGRIAALSEDPQRYVAGIYLEGRFMGMLNETERTEDAIELGYALLPKYYNQGYCTEALTGAIGYLFGQGFGRVITGAFEENGASLRVMEKSGMVKIDRTDEVDYRGKTHRCIYYQIEKQ